MNSGGSACARQSKRRLIRNATPSPMVTLSTRPLRALYKGKLLERATPKARCGNEQSARGKQPLAAGLLVSLKEGNVMKLLSLTLLSVGLMLAQSSQSTTTTTDTKSKHHGKDVKSDTTTSTTRTDDLGNSTTDTSTTKTKSKRHHGKVKTKSKTKDSTSTTE